MADWRLDQKTEETPQGTDLSLLVRGTSVFKTTFQKIKEFIIGTTVMGTTATDVTGAVKELNDKIGSEEKEGSIISQLKDLTNNKADKKNSEFIGTMKLNNKDVSTSEIIDLSVLSFENGWKLFDDTSYNSKIVKEGNMVHLNVLVANDSPALSTTVFILPESLRPLKCAITLSNQGTRIIEARIYTDGRLIFQSGEITPSSWININMTYSLK